MKKNLRRSLAEAILAGVCLLAAGAVARAADFDQGTLPDILGQAGQGALAMADLPGAAVGQAQGGAAKAGRRPHASTVVAPYYDIANPPAPGSDKPEPTAGLMDAHQKAGLDHAIIFSQGISASGDCPDISQARPDVLDDMRAFAALGKDMLISISGATCGSTPGQNLADVLDYMIRRTGAYGIDFDVEDNYVASQPDTERRDQAIVELKRRFPDLFISFTLAATPGVDYNAGGSGQAGLSGADYALLRATLAGGVPIDRVNVMAFSWGFSKATLAQYPYYKLAEMTVESVAQQVGALLPPGSDVYAMLGVTACIGLGDEPVPFYPSDALRLGAYARQKGLGLVSYYQFQMDRRQDKYGQRDGNGAATKDWLDESQNWYSGVPQKDFDFFRAFQGVAPAP
jgi:hypothetical protein